MQMTVWLRARCVCCALSLVFAPLVRLRALRRCVRAAPRHALAALRIPSGCKRGGAFALCLVFAVSHLLYRFALVIAWSGDRPPRTARTRFHALARDNWLLITDGIP